MNAVFIIPTGLGCAIGGHAGDATPAAKLIAQCCDNLILHPNVVNASDINEMPSNALYVEGSMLDRFLEGEIELRPVSGNRVLVAVNPPLKPETVNAINAARTTIGGQFDVMELETPLVMDGYVSAGVACGAHSGTGDLIDQVRAYKPQFDALAIASPINVPESAALEYFRDSSARVNPWGGIEAIVSKQVAEALGKPVAHAPIECDDTKAETELMEILYNEVVDPRKAAEVCSSCYIHCVLKGLHRAPRIGKGINVSSVSCLVSPVGCVGRPHQACFDAGIPVIAVEENTTVRNERDNRVIYVQNYLEAAGVVQCIMAGITHESVRAAQDIAEIKGI